MTRVLVRATLATLLVALVPAAGRADDGHAHTPVQQAGYVKLDAPLNPVPQPYVPRYVGGALITNQALYAHEMLYPHEYRALYPPYYYRVKRYPVLTPYGFRQRESWRLMGTEVKVKYRSSYSPFALFLPPTTSSH